MAVLLVVSAEERRRRLLGRGEQLTEEETKLDKSKLFQERLAVLCTSVINMHIYHRIPQKQLPCMIVILSCDDHYQIWKAAHYW